MSQKILVVGIGSSFAADQVGWFIARDLMQRRLADCDVRIASTPCDLLNWIEDFHTLHLCDACYGACQPGTIHRRVWPDVQFEDWAWRGTHDFRLPDVLKLAFQLGLLPAHVIVWGIDVSNVDSYDGLTKFFDRVVPEASHRIASELIPIASEVARA